MKKPYGYDFLWPSRERQGEIENVYKGKINSYLNCLDFFLNVCSLRLPLFLSLLFVPCSGSPCLFC